jgi:uncharacterized membrane protein YgcG
VQELQSQLELQRQRTAEHALTGPAAVPSPLPLPLPPPLPLPLPLPPAGARSGRGGSGARASGAAPQNGRGGGGGGGGGGGRASFGWEELERWLRELSPEEARQARERLLSELHSDS